MLTNLIHEMNVFTRNNPLRLGSRLRSKVNEPGAAKDVLNYLETSPEYLKIKDSVPKFLLKKYKTPESMYLINTDTAKKIVNNIKSHLNTESPVVEVNPGFGILTQELLQYHNHLYLYESSNQFFKHIENLLNQYPGRITYKTADLFGMWKLAFRDKMDQGTRIEDLLGDLSTTDNDRVVKIIGSMPGMAFIKHLIFNIVFLSTTSRLGRPDLFITMPGHQYEFLTDTAIPFTKHSSTPALFQLLFDYKILTNVPKVHFLPWTHRPNTKKVSMMDEYCLYLVNITQKEELPCQPEYLPLLWYFFKPLVFCKTARVIPALEQWIPGCGVWLITGQDPPDTNTTLSPGKDDAPLPHMTIFTEFGDLNLKQKITLFKKFISWPEFEQCPFRTTMENDYPKSVLGAEDDKESIPGAAIDDSDHSDLENKN